ncbi:MAG: hypothetical protein HUU38_00930 [Anaerolineales bacterium]|nr:hypothetical protein [Anaerolineales bacterium]
MSLIQNLIRSLLPAKLAADMEADSKRWVLTCPNCNHVQSVWEIGGVRYKAFSKGKRTGIRCLNCKQWHMMPMTYQK